LRADLQTLSRETGGNVLVEDLPLTSTGRRRHGEGKPESLTARTPTREIPRDWRITSYSWLASGAESERPDYDPVPPEQAADIQPPAAGVDEIFLFPRGVQAGHFLHALLEHLDFPSADGEGLTVSAAAMLERYGLEPSWAPVVSRSVGSVLDTALDDARVLRLRDLGSGDRLNELEFHFAIERLDPIALKRRLEAFEGYRSAAEGLTFESVRGLMKGYIDLVFRADGRFYLADYKSNHLGDRLEDYGDSGLRRAMRAHRYDLQYLIYTLALHRYLRRRLRGYEYERHFGGAYYLFLRGMRPEQGPRFGVYYDRPPVALVEALDRLFSGEALARDGGHGGRTS
jgi:exodeoxyribonuclease V beta subunit